MFVLLLVKWKLHRQSLFFKKRLHIDVRSRLSIYTVATVISDCLRVLFVLRRLSTGAVGDFGLKFRRCIEQKLSYKHIYMYWVI